MTPSTRTRFLSAITRRTRPCLPLSLPAITSTLSFRLILIPAITLSLPRRSCYPGAGPRFTCCTLPRTEGVKLNDLRRERDDLEELLLAKLAGYRTKDAGADRLVDVVDYNGGVLVETNVRAIAAAILLARADDDSLDDFTFFDGAVGRGFFDGSGDDVAEAGLFAKAATEG